MSFLRRKSKQEPPPPPKQPLPPLASSPPAPTPLFAKFSSTSNGGAGNPARNVSGPMTLSSSTRREPSLKHSAGRSSSSKEKQTAPSSWYVQPPPPPPQSPDRGSSTLSTSPPSTLRNYSRPMPSRTSLKTTEDKPLPMPIPVRRPSVQQTSFSPPPKTSNNGYRASANVTNLLDDEFEFESPAAVQVVPMPRTSQARANGVGGAGGGGGGGPPRLSYAVDLPPEFALFQEFSASSSPPDPSPSRKLNGHQPASTYNPTPTPKSILQNRDASPPKPPKVSSMGNSISTSASQPSLYPSSIGALQPAPRSMTNPPHQPPTSFPASAPTTPTKASYRRSVHAEPLPPLPPGAGAVMPGPYIAHGVPGQLFQPPPMMVAPAPMTKGKPRIFAAMGTEEEDTTPTPVQSYPPPNPPSNSSSPPRPTQQQFAPPPAQAAYQPPLSSSSSRQAGKRPQSMAQAQASLPPLSPQPQSDLGHGQTHNQTQQPFHLQPPQQPPFQPQQQQQPRRNDSRPLPGPSPSSPPRAQSILSNNDKSSIQGSPRTPKKLLKARHRDNTTREGSGDALQRASIMSASVESFHSTVSHVEHSQHGHSQHGHGIIKTHADGHRTLAKNPHHQHLQNVASRPGSSNSHRSSPSKVDSVQPSESVVMVDPPIQVDQETRGAAGIPLDDDPFAKVEGVRVLSPLQDEAALQEDVVRRQKSAQNPPAEDVTPRAEVPPPLKSSSSSRREKSKDETPEEREERRRERRERRAREKEERKAKEREAAALLQAASLPVNGHAVQPSSSSAEIDPSNADPNADQQEVEPEEPKFFPFTQFIAVPALLGSLLSYMTFYDWCVLSSVSREVRIMLVQSPLLREEVLERFLKTVGYARWSWEGKDPLQLTLQDLADYMRGVSTPSHEYARVAKMYVHTLSLRPPVRDPSLDYTLRSMTTSTRAYTRVVLRLRAQAEKESSTAANNRSATPPRSASVPPSSASSAAKLANGYNNGAYGSSRSVSRPPSRAPSPAMSNYSHFGGSSTHVNHAGLAPPPMNHNNSSQTSLAFRSPLFRLRRAPLLRVFVPSPEGDWLSDKSVLDCESELKKCGATGLMRRGDVVWDIAVGDEGNVGRLVYDGKYLLDLDYTYNPIGDLPRYIPTLAFPPSYFHRVIRTGAITSNPIAHVDISPWGEEIAANLQLLQDRVKTETPQGAYHNVVRWVHRSSFAIRPPARVMQRGTSTNGRPPPQAQPHTPRIPIPDTDGLFIDSGWYGTIVVETEGTNEALADLQERCGPRAFPPRPKTGGNPGMVKAREENRKVWRILRERSRPGEIWIKAVSVKERLL